jgi:hypothetical protein
MKRVVLLTEERKKKEISEMIENTLMSGPVPSECQKECTQKFITKLSTNKLR